MMSILDQVARRRPQAVHRPATVRELFVLRLAHKLGECQAVTHYAELARDRSDETLLYAFRKASTGTDPGGVARRFHAELACAGNRSDQSPSGWLLAIKVERRSIAVAVFAGPRLDFHEVRQLSSQPDKATASATGFVNWVLANFEIESAALERLANGKQTRRAQLNRTVLDLLRQCAVPVWEVAKPDLLGAFGHPPLRSRVELRQSARTILWSMFNTDSPDSHELDAAALGLYVQIERLFLH